MVAILIIFGAVFSIADTFTGSMRASALAGQRVEATNLAIRDIEMMQAVPYDQLGFQATVAGYNSVFVDHGQTYNTVTVAMSQLVPTPASVSLGPVTYNLTRSLYWVDQNLQPVAAGAGYKMATVVVAWSQAGGQSVRQDRIFYPGGLGKAAATTTTTVAAGYPAAPALTAAPNLRYPASTIDLNWSEGSTVTAFAIQYSTDGFATAQDKGTTNANVNRTSISGLAAGAAYAFRVGAINGSQGPVWSNVVTVSTAPAAGSTACQVLSVNVSPSTVKRSATTYQLPSPPTVSVSTSGSCRALSVRYTPSGASSYRADPLVANSTYTTWTVTLAGAVPWSLGDHFVGIWNDSANTQFQSSNFVTVQ